MTLDLADPAELPLRALLEAFATTVAPIEGGVRLVMERTDVTVGGVRNGINGGVLGAFVELAGHLALRAVLEDGVHIERTQEVGLSFLSAARSQTVAEARVLRVGGRLAVAEVEVRDGESGTLNAAGRVTCVLARPPREEAS
ncbi:MAG: PaaI family thioesterase [Dehalococcoidia bacterium]